MFHFWIVADELELDSSALRTHHRARFGDSDVALVFNVELDDRALCLLREWIGQM
jgi:hypothetical protein